MSVSSSAIGKSRSFFPFLLGIFLALSSLLSGCEEDPEDIPLDTVQIDFNTHRLDLDMYAVTQAYRENPGADSAKIYQETFAPHEDFLIDWIFYGDDSLASDSVFTLFFAEFLRDTNAHRLFADIAQRYPAAAEPEKALLAPLENLLKRYKYYFPQDPIPAVLTFVDGYPQTIQAGLEQVFITRRFIGIGIHYLMGASYRYYPPDMPKYLRRRCNPEHLQAMVAHQYADLMIPPPPIEKNPVLIDHVVQQGLQLYLVDKLLGPEVPDSIKLYYNAEQMLWADTYEARAYKDMVPLLYEVDARTIMRYTNDSPFTSQLSRESAPRLGWFIGLKIISKYAEKFPEQSLADLIRRRDYQQIFKQSGYRPG